MMTSENTVLLANACLMDKDGLLHDRQSIVVDGNQIKWCGDDDLIPEQYLNGVSVENCQGQLITPSLIDCHTHLVYAGHRADEFKMKLNGATYEELSRRGGGIQSTVNQTRKASEQELFDQSLPRIKALQQEGVMTVEIKSGYGLDLETELKMLRVAKRLGVETGMTVFTTYLGAHALPLEYKTNRQDYVRFVCHEVIPLVAEQNLADAVDVFCESIGFTLDETQQIFEVADQYQLKIKCHAEQLSNMGASKLAAQYNALSTDHLEYLDDVGLDAMKRADTVAVLLPGAYYFLKEKKCPPVDALRSKGVGIAVATDSNPGSSPTTSLQLMLSMACQFFSLTVEEALSGVTHQASRALGIESSTGSIAVGKKADLLKWPFKDNASLCYTFGTPHHPQMLHNGKWVRLAET